MTGPDQDLATILAALSSAEPSPGLQQRILTHLVNHQAASAEPAPTASPRRPAHALPVAGWLSLAAALLLTASLAFLHPHRPAVILSAAPSPALAPPAPAAVPLCCVRRQSSPARLVAGPSPSHHTHSIRSASSASSRVASFPAPPLPLTAQEKLLLRVARAANPAQSPLLNPALRASLTARDSEDFQIFFAPATTVRKDEPAN